MSRSIQVKVLSGSLLEAHQPALAEILLENVLDGASVGFMDDLSVTEARKFWRKVAQRSENQELVVLGAFSDEVLAGTVQLVLAPQPNQPHRADVAKLLVSPRYRRLGAATALMKQVENVALRLGRNLLVLDTLSQSGAETLYVELGWKKVGEIPRHALLPEGGEPLATSVFYKDLSK